MLQVFVNEATNLFGADLDGSSDPYCVIKIGQGNNQFTNIQKTIQVKNTKNPVWQETFTLPVMNPSSDFLVVEVWNKETISRDNSLGYAQVPLNDLYQGVAKQTWIQLEGGSHGSNIIGAIASHLPSRKDQNKNRPNTGKVSLTLTALDFGLNPAMQQGQQGMMQQGMQPGMQGMQPGMQGMQPGMMQQPGTVQPGMMQQPGTVQPGMMQQPMMQQGMQGMQPGVQQPGVQQPGYNQTPSTINSGYNQGVQQPGYNQGANTTTNPLNPLTPFSSSSTHPPTTSAQKASNNHPPANSQNI